ncbi:hypothetical protein Lal_00030775 [Lupinus albus]|nr:hypothetical protein Lal_00030775 [Lupinus albus]
MGTLLFIVSVILSSLAAAVSSPNGGSEFLEKCSSNVDCAAELLFEACSRSSVKNPFKIANTSLPFNKYAFLTTHNSFAIGSGPILDAVPRLTFINQEDNITEQLRNGVRALMLDAYNTKEIYGCAIQLTVCVMTTLHL